MIVRDEARSIARCLTSLRPWVDRVVVVDTGSSDDTVAIAGRAGAEVHSFPWCDDFAAARNHALACADADWNLMIDADEWLESGGAALRAFIAGAPRLGVVCVESSYAQGGDRTGSNRAWITRLMPRGALYAGRIHEQVVSDLPRHRVEAVLGHNGYLPAQMERKRDRNRDLLLRELRDHPDDPYLHFQLGREAEGRGDHAEAVARYRRAATDPTARWAHDLSVRHLHCLARCGRFEDAFALAHVEMARWPESPDLFFVLGNLLLDRAMTDQANAITQWLPLAIGAWERCLEIGERPLLDGSVAGRGSHLAQHNLDVVRSQLAMLAA